MDGVQTCFKNINRCNLHPQCDPVHVKNDDDDSDDDDDDDDDDNYYKTAEDELKCDEEYKRLLPRQATFPCQSPHHNVDSVKANISRGVVWIKAVPYDGIPECWNDEDEKQSPWYISVKIIGDIKNIPRNFRHNIYLLTFAI